jgi:hypothetical protein
VEGLSILKKFNDLIKNQTSDLLAGSIMPQQTMLLHAPFLVLERLAKNEITVLQQH